MTVAGLSVDAVAQPDRVLHFRALFFVAAAWNVAGAVMGLFFLDVLSEHAWPGTALVGDPISIQFAMTVFALIGVLGLGYAFVAFDPTRNRGLVLVAAIGKPIVLALGVYYSWGLGSAWLLVPAGGIVFFTSSFWWFLFSTRRSGWY